MFDHRRIIVCLGIIIASIVLASCELPDTACVDEDGDNYYAIDHINCPQGNDCDDNHATVYPGAPELCDGIDNQCIGDTGHGSVDEGYDACGDMAQIPTGCFEMGDHFDDGNIYDSPVHNVCISAFEMDMHEVTNSEYAECVGDGGCTPPIHTDSFSRETYYGDPVYNDYPVIWVDWYQATDYCTWAGKRLPTEAEWEYAARGGLSGKRYPWGDTISGSDANYGDSGDPWDNDTSPVGYYAANGYGLYDMSGNVYEWINDLWDPFYYQYCIDNGIVNNPPGPASGTAPVVRSGSWYIGTIVQRVASRTFGQFNPPGHCNHLGFRCARGGAYSP